MKGGRHEHDIVFVIAAPGIAIGIESGDSLV